MNRKEFKKRLENEILVLDGAYGTEFFKMGFGNIPGEILNLQHPEAVEKLQRSYVENGSDILLANTFNANPLKLKKMGYESEFEKINYEAVKIARKAGNDNTLVFGDMSSTGEFPAPMGKNDFEEVVQSYHAQAQVLLDCQVDGFIIETMSDLKELKAAILGIREVTNDLPIIAHMTFEENGKAVTGTDVKIFATLMNDLDVDVVGMNCSTGPEEMLDNFRILAENCDKFLSLEPNAGKPVYENKRLTYKTTPADFAIYIEDFIHLGANIIGGCCGTTAEHIKLIHRFAKNLKPAKRDISIKQIISSRTEYCEIDPFMIIGERINPAGKKRFQAQIRDFDFSKAIKEADLQKKEGAHILDVNLGIEKTLNESHFRKMVIQFDKNSLLPLSLDIQTNKYLRSVMREYTGRPLINSAKVTPKSLSHKIKLLNNYGGMIILLAMTKKIPATAEERFAIVMEGIAEFERNGISRDRIFADPLTLSLGAKQNPKVTVKTIELLHQAGIKTTLGLSNLSFGLPNRDILNGTFLANCLYHGLNSAIMNPGEDFVMNSLYGGLTLRGEELSREKKSYDDPAVDAILAADSNGLNVRINNELKSKTPLDISQNILGKAMEEIGKLYSKGKIYLPQLLLAADIVHPIFDRLNEMISSDVSSKGKIVIATVEGDIHDIGKNIVATILRSSGFEVIDIGTDVTDEFIVQKVIDLKPDILALSAMMTTTIGQIDNITKKLRSQNIKIITISGGASMNKKLAKEFGCDGYAQNASTVVELCEGLIGIE